MCVFSFSFLSLNARTSLNQPLPSLCSPHSPSLGPSHLVPSTFMSFGLAFVIYTFRHPLNLRTIEDDWEGLSVVVEGLEVVGADWDTESNRLIQLQDTKTINRLHIYASFGRIVFICLQSIFLVLLMRPKWIKHIYLHH